MRRLLIASCAAMGLTGCLEPGDPLLAVRDTDPPELQSTVPAANAEVAKDGTLSVTFSELMDERTLRPGIAVFSGQTEVALRITVPPLSGIDEDTERGDLPYTVMVGAASGAFASNTSYTLVLRTSLTDYEGNALVEEVRVPFRSSF
ncbi:Ig-like domain-containing protein [Hyalangium rubrum]|uniref:Ig-like domain-containing protein n=1 Tax=Hyalangium rubrum TaxID=3103134 RepID=A0ABU5HC33_9BACT|nr:Ig-like domain-containing protein [Hyalangium sp. s54d21]MDY7230692.1 Ig-like domain-containing protein [Hyalangium sp. s54d21]